MEKPMPGSSILREDWEDYEVRKLLAFRDQRYFSVDEDWEVDYLVNKIYMRYAFPHGQIRKAIKECSIIVGPPWPREAFVHCVMRRLQRG